jgi:thioredoxin
MSTREVTSAGFDRLVDEHDIVLVDFWAAWCGPCRQFAPVFESAAEKHTDIVFAKVDTDAEQQLAARAQISSIPTLMAFREGICVFAQPGALPPAALEQLIDAVRALDMDDVRRQVAAAEGDTAEVDLETFAARHAEGGYVLDVREPYEYAAGHVPGAVPMPMNDVPVRLAELPRDRVVHVICQSGHRSRSVTDWLREQGVDAVNVAGGTGEWEARGWALER